MNEARWIGDLWLIFIIYWAVSATRSKRTAYRAGSAYWWLGSRILLIAAFIFALHTPLARLFLFTNPAIRTTGVVLCAAGIALAIWARTTLGANWSGIPSIKVGHELVTSGAYRWVRHPIYTGLWVALLGSALAGSAVWWIALALSCFVVAYRVRKEESLMMQQFPAEYPEYVRRTKALVPFVF